MVSLQQVFYKDYPSESAFVKVKHINCFGCFSLTMQTGATNIYVYLYICTAVQLHITNPNLMYVPIAIVKLIIPVSSHQNERIPLSLRKKRKQQRDK